MQEADGGKGVTSAAAELCGIALRQSRSRKVLNAADPAQERPLVFLWNMSDNWPVDSILSFFCGVALYKSGGGDRARCVHIPQQKSRPPVSGPFCKSRKTKMEMADRVEIYKYKTVRVA